MLKLYYHPLSPNNYNVLALIDYLGLKVETILTDPFKGETRTPEYLKMNPNAKVPTLFDEEEDFALFESNAIMQYLASKVPGTPLWPKDDKIRADITRWQFWQQAHWMANGCSILLWENLLKGLMNLGDPDPAAVKRGEEGVKRYGKVLDDYLADKDYLVNNQLTLADFSVASPLAYAEACQFPIAEFKNLQAWYGRMSKLEVWQKHLPKVPG